MNDDGWTEIYPRRPRQQPQAPAMVQVELWGGPRDGERRTVRADALERPLTFDQLADGRGLAVETAEALGVADVPIVQHTYRQPLPIDALDALVAMNATIRFDYEPPAGATA